jgi:hypothetical protein
MQSQPVKVDCVGVKAGCRQDDQVFRVSFLLLLSFYLQLDKL